MEICPNIVGHYRFSIIFQSTGMNESKLIEATRKDYLHFLQHNLDGLLEEVPLAKHRDI